MTKKTNNGVDKTLRRLSLDRETPKSAFILLLLLYCLFDRFHHFPCELFELLIQRLGCRSVVGVRHDRIAISRQDSVKAIVLVEVIPQMCHHEADGFCGVDVTHSFSDDSILNIDFFCHIP